MKSEGLHKKAIIGLISFSVLGFSYMPSFAADTIKLGVAGVHSGYLTSYGIPSIRAAKLVAEKLNAKGGTPGKRIAVRRV